MNTIIEDLQALGDSVDQVVDKLRSLLANCSEEREQAQKQLYQLQKDYEILKVDYEDLQSDYNLLQAALSNRPG